MPRGRRPRTLTTAAAMHRRGADQPAEKERARARLRVHGPIVWCGRWRAYERHGRPQRLARSSKDPSLEFAFPGPRDRRRRVRRRPDRLHRLPFPAGRGFARSTSAAARPASAARATSSSPRSASPAARCTGWRRPRASPPSCWRNASTGPAGWTSRSSPARSSSTGGRATTPSIPTRSSGAPRSEPRARASSRSARAAPAARPRSGRSSTTRRGSPRVRAPHSGRSERRRSPSSRS